MDRRSGRDHSARLVVTAEDEMVDHMIVLSYSSSRGVRRMQGVIAYIHVRD
jgi:hypothetical protein